MTGFGLWIVRAILAAVIARRPEKAHAVVSWAAGELARGTCWTEAIKARLADAWVKAGT